MLLPGWLCRYPFAKLILLVEGFNGILFSVLDVLIISYVSDALALLMFDPMFAA